MKSEELRHFRMSEKGLTEYKETLVISDEKQLEEFEKKVKGLSKEDGYICMKSNLMLKLPEVNEKSLRLISENLGEKLADKKQLASAIDKIFNELIEGAYLDRMVAYTIRADGTYNNLEIIQSIRQKADNHLIRLIKAYMDIKKPTIKVLVRSLDQINISDKQININQKNANDLDKNEKIS